MLSEFEIIRQYFTSAQSRPDVILGIGDDAAILRVPEQHELVQSVDTLVAGVHFPAETSPEDIAYKALAVNLSDMAAMGAEPAWFTLAITMPDNNTDWLKAFSESLSLIANNYNLQLVGGDTTKGPLCISISINGFVPLGKALTRNTAQAGDKLYVSGTIGDAALALAAWQGKYLLNQKSAGFINARLNRPEPQIKLGLLLREYASSCIDISDGLIADLGHITEHSNVGAKINFEKIPRSKEFNSNLTEEADIIPLILSGGDDYELCFTIPASKQNEFEIKARDNGILVSVIGEIENQPGIRCIKDKKEVNINETGFQHFYND